MDVGGKGASLEQQANKGGTEQHQADGRRQEEQRQRPYCTRQGPGQGAILLASGHLGRKGQKDKAQGVGQDGGQGLNDLAGESQSRYATHANLGGKRILDEGADKEGKGESSQQGRSQTAHGAYRGHGQVQ